MQLCLARASEAHTLEALRLRDGPWGMIAVHEGAARARIEPFEAIELDVAVLWAGAALPIRASESPAHYVVEGH